MVNLRFKPCNDPLKKPKLAENKKGHLGDCEDDGRRPTNYRMNLTDGNEKKVRAACR